MKLKQIKKSQFYYHITDKDFGSKVTFIPMRTCEATYNRDTREPKIARICVAPAVAYCLSCINASIDTYRVYKTIKKIRPFYPVKVVDSHISREKWITQPAQFVLVRKINKNIMREVAYNAPFCGLSKKENVNIIKKILKKYNINNTP